MRPNQELVAVKYFSAKPDDIDQSLRQNAFFQANRENLKFKLILGKYLKKSITCFKCGNVIHTHEEKETDVRIATQIVADAYQKNCDISIVVSADSDMIPAIELATEACQKVFVYFPPYQYSSNLATMGMGKPIHMKLVSGNVFYLMWYILERQTLIYRYLRNGRLFSQSESEICVIKKENP